jgi:hypothetical protein
MSAAVYSDGERLNIRPRVLEVQSKELSSHHNNDAAFALLISTDVKFVNIFQNKIEDAGF